MSVKLICLMVHRFYIKPYIPLADKIDQANSGWADIPVKKYRVQVSVDAREDFKNFDPSGDLEKMAIAMIELDPRPAFQKRKIPVEDVLSVGRKFGIDILNFDAKYEIIDGGFLITKVLIK